MTTRMINRDSKAWTIWMNTSKLTGSTTNNHLIVILGPTAIGKTAMGIEVAQQFGCEILSSDSRQFFREMSVGTAKPDKGELEAVKHHFIDSLSIHDDYSAGHYERDALALLKDLFENNPVAVMVGGSGLYVDAVCKGFDDLPRAPEQRQHVIELFEKEGLEALQQKLIALDPEIESIIDMQNSQRVMRALEVSLVSQKPYSSFRTNVSKQRPFNITKIALNDEREVIYDRINRRVDLMVEHGLVEEARSLFEHKDLNALKTVGYQELFDHFDGKSSMEEAVARIKQNTRRFAKRQLTWLRRDESVHWFDAKNKNGILDFCKKELNVE